VLEITEGEKERMGGVATHLARVAVNDRRCEHHHSITEDNHQEESKERVEIRAAKL
jgi:hypothetical protein